MDRERNHFPETCPHFPHTVINEIHHEDCMWPHILAHLRNVFNPLVRDTALLDHMTIFEWVSTLRILEYILLHFSVEAILSILQMLFFVAFNSSCLSPLCLLNFPFALFVSCALFL